MLILLILSAMALDSAVTFLAQRRLAGACLDAANDAATRALDSEALNGRANSDLSIDQATAQAIADAAAERLVDGRFVENATCTASVGPPTAVRMRGSATVRLLFAPAIPGRRLTQTVEADETANVNQRG